MQHGSKRDDATHRARRQMFEQQRGVAAHGVSEYNRSLEALMMNVRLQRHGKARHHERDALLQRSASVTGQLDGVN